MSSNYLNLNLYFGLNTLQLVYVCLISIISLSCLNCESSDSFGVINITKLLFLFLIWVLFVVNNNKEESYKVSKAADKYKLFEIFYSQKEAWSIINSPQYVNLPVVKKIKEMWTNVKPPNIIEKKARKRSKKKITTTTIAPRGGARHSESEYDSDEATTPHQETTTELIETTTKLETTTERVRLPGRQNPFILIEGTLTTSRRKLLRELMKHTTFAYIRNFRKTPFDYSDKFGGYKLLKLKRAYVTLQFYITGRDIERILEERPVIMSGFWMRQAAEMIARQHPQMDLLPPVGSDCYKWPSDLVRPDLVFFLHTPRTDTHIQPDTQERLNRIVEAYHRMDPPVIALDESYSTPTVEQITKLRSEIVDKLKAEFPHADTFLKYKIKVKNPFARRPATNKTLKSKSAQQQNVTVIDDCKENKTLPADD